MMGAVIAVWLFMSAYAVATAIYVAFMGLRWLFVRLMFGKPTLK
jgi:hypothetical protein